MNLVPERLTAALADRYRIERELGAGGMATVYLAHDLKHDRPVALKVLRPELAAVLGAERFLAEIKTTARLQHPGILTLIDSGAAAGLLYYVMPYVAGESLRARLAREQRLPVADAVRIASGVAAALDFAHRHGIVHRDVKPENILLHEGVPLVADFGIALAVRSAGAERLTETGMSLGTPAYMSPEQITATRELDGRSDQYSLACVLYELVSGAPPFTAPTAQGLAVKHVTELAPPLRGAEASVAAAVARALAKDPADRFPSLADFAAALTAPIVAPVAAPTEPPIPRRPHPLVGRAAERAELLARLDRLEVGQGGLVLLGGEPGVGKTRLAEALIEAAFARGYTCLVGHCYEMDGTPAYTPVIEHLEGLARILPTAALREVLGDAAPEIARFYPGLRRVLPEVGPPMELPPDQQRQYLHARFREYVARLTARGPVVALADDMHWADDSSLLLLEALAGDLGEAPLLIVGTYRDVDLDVARPFAKVLERLTRQRRAERLAVRRLPEGDVAELLAVLGGSAPPADLVHAIQHETEGNPFFVEEVFAHLKEEGRLFDARGAWRSDLSLAELDVPEGVKLVVGRRLERVSEATRSALTLAAVVGPRFTIELLEGAGETRGDALLDALEDAERAGLIRPLTGGRETRYGFGHELIRHTLVTALSLPRRQRWHLRIADTVERLYPGRLGEHAADLAYHLFQAGAAAELGRTVGALVRAAELALGAGAFDEATAQVERARSLEPEEPTQRADLLRIRGNAARGLGRWDRAREDVEAALDLYEKLGDRRHLMLYFDLAELKGWGADVTATLDLVYRGIAAAGSGPEHAEVRALLGAIGCEFAFFAGRQDESDKLLAMAAATNAELGSPRVAAAVAIWGDSVKWGQGRVAEAAANMHRSARAIETTGNVWDLANAFGRYPLLLALLGRYQVLRRELPWMTPVIERAGYSASRMTLDFAVGFADWGETGDVEQAERHYASRQDAWGAVAPTMREYCLVYTYLARFYRGEWSESISVLDRLGQAAFPSQVDQLWAYPFLIKAYRRAPGASETVESRRDRLPRAGLPAFSGAWWSLKMVIEGLMVLGQRARAAEFYPAAVEMVDRGYVLDFTGAFECSTALAAAAGAQWDLAERHFESALRTVDTAPHILGQAETRRWYAWMCLERGAAGDREKAAGLLEHAIRVYERIGMPKHLELARALQSRGAS